MKRLMPQTQDAARSPAARSEASRSKASSLSDVSAQLRADDECDTEIETNAMVRVVQYKMILKGGSVSNTR